MRANGVFLPAWSGAARIEVEQAWVLRPIVLFVTAYAIIGILHELVHAVTAYLLGVPSTLTHVAVNLDPPYGSLEQRAIVAAAGPLASLAVGLLSWISSRKMPGSRFGLPLLYLTMFGAGTFFGNLMSASFVGDFSRVADALRMPTPARYAVSVAGLLLLCGLSFLVGWELRRWVPAGVGSAVGMMGIVALPAIAGTAIALLIFLPMPPAFVLSRITESSFWICAAVGALVSRRPGAESGYNLGLGWADGAALAVAVVVVRLAAGGIAFVP